MADKLTAEMFAADGSSAGEFDLDPGIFGIEPNVPVMHQVVNAQLAAARAGTHSTKTRSEVRGGGRKPWRQKGLGRARHGSIRSPMWVGGGVAHGPKPRDYTQRVNRKMRRLALHSSLSARAAEGKVKVAEDFDWSEPKTKTAQAFLSGANAAGKVLVVLAPNDATAKLSFRNLPHVRINGVGQLATYDVLWADEVVFTATALGQLQGDDSYDVTDSDFVREDAEADEAPVEAGVPDTAAEAEASAVAEGGEE